MADLRLKMKDGELSFSVEDLINSLGEDERRQVAKLIGADVEAWRQMAEAVADPTGCYNSDEERGPWWFDDAAMNTVRAKLVPMMPAVMRAAAAEWQRQVDDAQKEQKRFHDWAWSMYRAHTDIMVGRAGIKSFPAIPGWAPAVRAEMRVRDAAPMMLEALRSVTQGDCPGCMLSSDDGHTAECIVGAALRAAEPPEETT